MNCITLLPLVCNLRNKITNYKVLFISCNNLIRPQLWNKIRGCSSRLMISAYCTTCHFISPIFKLMLTIELSPLHTLLKYHQREHHIYQGRLFSTVLHPPCGKTYRLTDWNQLQPLSVPPLKTSSALPV